MRARKSAARATHSPRAQKGRSLLNLLVFLLVIGLAASNGANDVPKGVATLAGAGEAKLKTAVVWGACTTAAGCLLSLHFASKMTALFSKGIVSAHPTSAFAAAVLIGTVSWVALATWRKLPVSTTHALTGALLGAGLLLAKGADQWASLLTKVVEPLLISVLIAWVVSALLTFFARRVEHFTTARARTRLVEPDRELVPAGGAPERQGDPAPAPAAVAQPAAHRSLIGPAHWFTSGLTSFARGLNDTPKIVAVGSFALFAGMTPTNLLFVVTAAMAAGGLLIGRRVAARLANDVVKMSHVEGFTANLTTAVMVGLGAFEGLPMSTTHVSIGAIAGMTGTDVHRIHKKTLRDFAMAWLVTPPFAAVVAVLAYLALR